LSGGTCDVTGKSYEIPGRALHDHVSPPSALHPAELGGVTSIARRVADVVLRAAEGGVAANRIGVPVLASLTDGARGICEPPTAGPAGGGRTVPLSLWAVGTAGVAGVWAKIGVGTCVDTKTNAIAAAASRRSSDIENTPCPQADRSTLNERA